MEIKEGHLIFGEYKTYYRIVNPNGRKIPLLLLHGGPGSTHNSFEVLDSLAFEDDRAFIMYDQLGCGLSSDAKDPSMYCKETWVKELMNVRDKLGLKKVHLLGHSWGGMLEIIYSCDYMPKGICSMVFSSTLASASLWREETHRLINLMPEKERMDILLGEEKQDFENEDFKKATELYMHRHVSGPWTDKDPECLTRQKRTGGLSYVTAWGPSEYAPLGNLKDYEYLDKLSRIKCPVLLFDGADDESTPYQNLSMYEKLTCEKKWVMFSHSRHMSLYEEKEKYAQELLSFLNHVDNCEGNR